MAETTKGQRDEWRYARMGSVILRREDFFKFLADAERLAEVEVALREEIDGLRASAYDVRDDGYFEWSHRWLRIQANRLQRILDGDEKYG